MKYQLSGGNGKDARTTGNICTLSTPVAIKSEPNMVHCNYSSSETLHGDQWVTAKLIMHGSAFAQHPKTVSQ